MDDSSDVAMPALSPDGKWIVFQRYVSDAEVQLWIRPVDGGAERRLLSIGGSNVVPKFTPAGDRLVFVSTAPRRGPTDRGEYIMVAPFNSATGSAGAPRQVTLDGARSGFFQQPAISPDGKRLAYVTCCTSNAVRVVPLGGGSATTLVPSTAVKGGPTTLVWTKDGGSLEFGKYDAGEYALYRVKASGGTPVEIGRSKLPFGRPFPGATMAVRAVQVPLGRPVTLQLIDRRGQTLAGDLELTWARGNPQFWPSADGRYIVVSRPKESAALRIASTTGGASRGPTTNAGYEWPTGWSSDSRTVISTGTEGGKSIYHRSDRDGKVVATYPTTMERHTDAAVLGDDIVETVWKAQSGIDVTWRQFSPANGTRRTFAAGVTARCCRAPGGAYNASADEFFYTRRVGDKLEVRGHHRDGSERTIGELPGTALAESKAVGRNTVVYWISRADSVFLMQARTGQPVSRVAAFPVTDAPGEWVFSHDGRKLVASFNGGRELRIYTFDDRNEVVGAPTRIPLPFQYIYEIYWLPDGSGMTMIAQERGSKWPHVALVKLADPGNPVILTRDDPNAKWGHVLSPDGKWVAYPSEVIAGSDVRLIDVAAALKALGKK